MPETSNVIVIGAGAMGSATAFHLAKKGQRVLALEQFDIPHGKGSSHGYSRMIRMAYFEHPDYVPLLRRAYLLWDQLEAEANQTIIHVTGGLYLARPDSELMQGSLRAVREYHLDHEELTRQQVRNRYPMFHVPEDYVGLIDEHAGFVLSEKAIAAHCEYALRRGAVIHGQEKVTAWKSTKTGVTVTTNRGSYQAAHLVFCSGAWTSKIVGELGVKLNVTRQVLGWVWPKRHELFALGKFPAWMMEHPDGTNHYGFPMTAENPGLKIAAHVRFGTTDPDTINRDFQPGDEESFLPILNYIPDAQGPILSAKICMYTNSPDTNFIIDRHPEFENVTLACGFSGHGFKFSSVIGEVLADLATTGKSKLPIDFLGLNRFKSAR